MVKNSIILTLFLVAVAFTACQKETIELPLYEAGNQEFGFATAKRNGVDWEASVICYALDDDSAVTCFVYTYLGDERIKENVYIGYMPTMIGKTKLDVEEDYTNRTFTPSYATKDADVLMELYLPDEEKGNWVNITCIDLETREIEGKFKFNFKVNEDNLPPPDTPHPEEVKFRNGHFKATIQEL